MSVLAPQDQAELSQLLQALQNSNNEVRSKAEELLQTNWTEPRPEVLLMGLVEQMAASEDATVCANPHTDCAVLYMD